MFFDPIKHFIALRLNLWSLYARLLFYLSAIAEPDSSQVPYQGVLIDTSSHSLAQPCQGYGFPQVICLPRYGAVMPGNFSRQVVPKVANSDTYPSTYVPEDDRFSSVANASFLIFNQQRAEQLLGESPSVDFMFELERAPHEAPVYVPETEELVFSRLQHQFLSQLVVNLKDTHPGRPQERVADPPIYAGCGSRYRKGLIYYSTIGGHENIRGRVYRPGIYVLNVTTWKSEVFLNNYFGYYLNAADDLDVDKHGHIWFTDNCK